MSEKIQTVKGFDSDLKCRDMQYEVGKEYDLHDGQKPSMCNCGFHAISPDYSPLSVFDFCPPSMNGKPSRYCEVEVSGKTDKRENKVVGSHIKIGAEIGIKGLIKAHIEWVKSRITNEHNAEPGKQATAGEYGAATAGVYGAATAGYRGAATAGDSGAATAGEYGAATAGVNGAATSRGSSAVGRNGLAVARGNGVMVKGGLGAILVIAEENNDNYDVKEWKAVVVDGETIKADTWYRLVDGELIECK